MTSRRARLGVPPTGQRTVDLVERSNWAYIKAQSMFEEPQITLPYCWSTSNNSQLNDRSASRVHPSFTHSSRIEEVREAMVTGENIKFQ